MLERTAYFVPGTEMVNPRRSGHRARIREADVPTKEGSIRLWTGDQLVLTRDLSPGHPALTDDGGRMISPAVIGCTLPEVFRDVRFGEPIWSDDGKLGGVAEGVSSDEIAVRIVHARPNGSKLRGGRGINVPATDLGLEALSPHDLSLLAFAVEHADLIGLSFVRSRNDVDALEQRLEELGGREPRHPREDRDGGRVPESADDPAGVDAFAVRRLDDRARRPCGRGWVPAPRGGSGGDPVAMRGGASACRVGDAGS
jgi:pyruvate kinase